MTHFLALIHKEPASAYGVSFPDPPGIVTAADTLDDAIRQAADALAFAAEDWEELTGQAFPVPRSFEDLRQVGQLDNAVGGVLIAAIPLRQAVPLAA